MNFEIFELERNQSLFENKVDFNLSESGVHPLKLSEILTRDEQKEILNLELSYGFTNGTPLLRNRVSEMYNSDLSKDNILITAGSAEANFLSVLTQLNSGDEIIYMIPNYLQIAHLSRSLGIIVRELPLRQELEWQWDVAELEKMVNNNTKMIVVCNPNNPTGSIISDEVFEAIITIAKDKGLWILSDEVYRGAELNGIECRTFAGTTLKSIVNGGLSKAYSLPGLRLGWTIGSKEYIKKAWSFHDYTVISVPYLSDWVSARILEENRRKKILSRTRTHLKTNLEIVESWSKEISELSFTMPKAAAITFAKINFPILSEDFVFLLRENKSVLITAGKWHGLEGFVRIGYGSPTEYVKNGLDRIKTFLIEK